MCHIIQRDNENTKFALSAGVMLGQKKLTVENSTNPLRAWAQNISYKYTVEDDRVSIHGEPCNQSIEFAVPTIDVYTTDKLNANMVRLDIRAGSHISPFDTNPHSDDKIFSMGHNAWLVAFYVSDFLFYDGLDVSVSNFFIPNKNFLETRFTYVMNHLKHGSDNPLSWYYANLDRLFEYAINNSQEV